MDTSIRTIVAREILDSRGNPTVEVEVWLDCGVMARAAAPSGASTGTYEAVELRDGELSRYGGKGVTKAVRLIREEIAPLLNGRDASDQTDIDGSMIMADGTRNKSSIGANSLIAVSIAVARASAMAENLPLWQYLGGSDANLMPVPMMNILNGGIHANWQGPDFQEYMIVPYGAPTFSEALRWGSETYQALKTILKEEGLGTGVGDEGGFAPTIRSNERPLGLIMKAIERAGYEPGKDIGVALDPASSAFCNNESYVLQSESRNLTTEEMIDQYESLLDIYPIVAIEDGLAEDDWDGWRELTQRLGNRVELVGDDLFVTNAERILKGIEKDVANAVLIKPNQIGTVTETVNAVKLAQVNKWGAMVSHRSGETSDTFISDFAVAMSTGHMKTGAPCRGERVEKYNQLLRIEEYIGDRAKYAGRGGFVNRIKWE